MEPFGKKRVFGPMRTVTIWTLAARQGRFARQDPYRNGCGHLNTRDAVPVYNLTVQFAEKVRWCVFYHPEKYHAASASCDPFPFDNRIICDFKRNFSWNRLGCHLNVVLYKWWIK
jgi:hypothetical protein